MERLNLTRGVLGLVSAAAMAFVAYDLLDVLRDAFSNGFRQMSTMGFVLLIGGFSGWGCLGITCWKRSLSIHGRTLALVVTLGVLGMAATLLVLGTKTTSSEFASVIILLIGLWVLNGFGIVWMWRLARHIHRESNRED